MRLSASEAFVVKGSTVFNTKTTASEAHVRHSSHKVYVEVPGIMLGFKLNEVSYVRGLGTR